MLRIPFRFKATGVVSEIHHIGNLLEGDNLLILVDEVTDSNAEEYAGWGEMPGNIVVSEVSALSGLKRNAIDHILHELGHNFGLEHLFGSNTIMDYGNTNVNFDEEQLRGDTPYYRNRTTPKPTKDDIQNMLDSKTKHYDKSKAKKAGLE